MVDFVIEIVIEIVIKFVMQTLDQINLTIRSTSDSYPLSVCMAMHRSTLVYIYIYIYNLQSIKILIGPLKSLRFLVVTLRL